MRSFPSRGSRRRVWFPARTLADSVAAKNAADFSCTTTSGTDREGPAKVCCLDPARLLRYPTIWISWMRSAFDNPRRQIHFSDYIQAGLIKHFAMLARNRNCFTRPTRICPCCARMRNPSPRPGRTTRMKTDSEIRLRERLQCAFIGAGADRGCSSGVYALSALDRADYGFCIKPICIGLPVPLLLSKLGTRRHRESASEPARGPCQTRLRPRPIFEISQFVGDAPTRDAKFGEFLKTVDGRFAAIPAL